MGCGVGTWLSVMMEKGIKDVMGLDGEWVEASMLVIPTEAFVKTDLNKSIRVRRRFDLAISLEVAEHLSAERAKGFVHDVTRLADFILFSAAVPFQGGRNHINEQWQTTGWGCSQRKDTAPTTSSGRRFGMTAKCHFGIGKIL